MTIYHAFDLFIESEYQIGLKYFKQPVFDSIIIQKEFKYESAIDLQNDLIDIITIENTASFYVYSSGEIHVLEHPNANQNAIRMYLTGLCMGCILHYRGDLPLHGSCVYKNHETVLITGESGAGKSTLTSELLQHGWKMMSDDLTVVKPNDHGKFYAYPGVPYQKLWDDACERQGIVLQPEDFIFEENGRIKYQIDRTNVFEEKAHQLTTIIYLDQGGDAFSCREVFEFNKIAVLSNNIYRKYFMTKQEQRNKAFQTCVDLSKQVRVFYIQNPVKNRKTEKELAAIIEEMIQK